MTPVRDFAVLYGTLLIFTLGRESASQTCDIDFHMEASSVMLIEGENASVLCDATCYGSQGDVDVVWMDAHARQIEFYPGRIFSVRYNRGLMNRLIIIGARTDTAGFYVCCVTRNGELLQQRPLEFIILGNSVVNNNFPQVDTGPRRGDMVPDRDLDYRPVRSVDRAISQLSSMSVPSVSDKTETISQEFKTNPIGDSHLNTDYPLSALFMLSNKNQRENNHLENVAGERSDVDTELKIFTNPKLYQKSEIPVHDSNDFVINLPTKMNRKSTFPMGELNDNSLKVKKVSTGQLMSSKNVRNGGLKNEIDNADSDDDSYVVSVEAHSRVKRETIENENITENLNLTTNYDNVNYTNVTTGDEYANQEISTSLTFTINNVTEQTFVTETDASETYPPEVSEKTKAALTDGDDDDDNGNNQSKQITTPCPRAEDSSTFGKYGVLAFAVTLAVAVLLIYAILMIIFMPRILARRKNKNDITEGAAYRKTEGSNMALMTVLEVQETDPFQENMETSDLDQSGSAGDKSDLEKKDEDSKEISASVSTFLLRQESQRKTEEDSNAVTNGSTTIANSEDKPVQLEKANNPVSNSQEHDSPKALADTDHKDDAISPLPSDSLTSTILPMENTTSIDKKE